MDAYQEVEKLLAEISMVARSPAIARKTEEISVLCRAYMTPPEHSFVDGVHLPPSELRVFKRIFQRPGEYVSKPAIFDALYFDRPDSPEIDGRIVDVFVCKLRALLKGTRYSIPINQSKGVGYCGLITEPSAAALTNLKAA